RSDFLASFHNKFFQLIDRQQKANEQTTKGRIYFTNKFYKMNMLLLIETLGYETPFGALGREVEMFTPRLSEMKLDISEIDEAQRKQFKMINVVNFPLSSVKN